MKITTPKKKRKVLLEFSTKVFKTDKHHRMIFNRHAYFVKYKKSFIKWDKKIYPWNETDPEYNIKTCKPVIILFWKRENESYKQWLKKNWKRIFKEELLEWFPEKRDRPKKFLIRCFADGAKLYSRI